MGREFKVDEQKRNMIKEAVQSSYLDDSIKVIAEEILLRRAFEYDFDNELVRRDCERLKNKFKIFRHADFSIEGPKCKWALGVSYRNPPMITLNMKNEKKLLKENKAEEIFYILAHELTHSLARDKKDRDMFALGMVKQDDGTYIETEANRYTLSSNEPMFNTGFLELVTEKLTHNIMREPSNKEKGKAYQYFHQDTKGYPECSTFLEMLETAYGMSEKEFLGIVVKEGRIGLAKEVSKRLGTTIDEEMEFLDNFEWNYNIYHNIRYPVENKKLPKDVEMVNMQALHGRLYNNLSRKMMQRIQNQVVNDAREAENLLNNSKFDFRRLDYLMKIQTEMIDIVYKANGNLVNNVFNECRLNRNYLIHQIEAMQDLENLDNIEAFNSRKNLNLESAYEDLSKRNETNGYENDTDFRFNIDEKTLQDRIEQDFPEQWYDNTAISEVIQREFPAQIQEREMLYKEAEKNFKRHKNIFYRFVDKLKEKFNNIIKRNTPKLVEAQGDIKIDSNKNKEATIENKSWDLTEEQMSKIDTEKALNNIMQNEYERPDDTKGR